MRLDIGCGKAPRGDVNCDLFIGETPHIGGRANTIEPKSIKNFVRCDASYLPFKSSFFDEVVAFHVLEHLENPTKALLEMMRVSHRSVTFVVPHRFARDSWLRYRQCKEHKHLFNISNIEKWLQKLNLHYDIKIGRKFFPHDYMPFVRLPWEIRVEIQKTEEF